ncbi:molybdopterin molybdotransferase MoeA [Shewanella sp. 1_MG-2023]|uniref:molybdopterin molybdotransferase MoeA n=1 Tax=unclassified Shewanella TaxID=196818 RepID=UPI0026E2B6FF|nr:MULTISPECIES: molybdopterin molybdotransferase MoeA [unclassified Shewanella]MDO6612803.1 molybdopterin molybdotransferase MoeA [Shewanella sp. 7_MG-2023]MDO6772764.1 molybdopterin molybdotransferase MoeA [Shewanella sp. 2_MG-2023]MDO6794928.1 molybdopterin molybdotransferase MoeA [Shewanella sp. 1_MG-2023]
MSTKSDSCAQPGLMHPTDAINALLDQVSVIEQSEMVSLNEAVGRILSEDLASCIDLPPFDNSSMDGYAFKFDELTGETATTLTLVGTSFAGHPYKGKIPANSCIRIMTGAPVPAGYDTVQMQEKTSADGDKITIEHPNAKGNSIRYCGEELTAGTNVLKSGTQIRAAEMGVLATIGISQIRVKARLKVAFFSTGDELRPVGSELAPGQIYDSNRYSIKGLLTQANVEWIDLGVIEDDKEAIRGAFREAAKKADMVLTSGGVSVGDADYTKQILSEEGEITFWRLAIKPGKPFAFGKLGKAVFCGLPGNPVSSMVTFYKLVWPIVNKMQGLTVKEPLIVKATLTSAIRKQPGRAEYQRGILSRDDNGELVVSTTGGQGSGMLTSMSLANCFINLEQEQGDIASGAQVNVEPFNSVLC